MSVLSLHGLVKTFDGVKAVAGVSFSVEAGEIVALIGPNGAGKTTLFNMANGQLVPDQGRVMLAGRDVTGVAPRSLWRLGVARTFQITATFASMTVAENVKVALMSRENELSAIFRSSPRLDAEAVDLLSEVGLADAADQICGVLSYGDLKRVELALALANHPRLLLMDEPTAGMAPPERSQLMSLVTRLARDRNTAVLFTEHDMGVVFGHAQRIVVMNRGEIVAEGSPHEVRGDPKVREVYLGTAPPSGAEHE